MPNFLFVDLFQNCLGPSLNTLVNQAKVANKHRSLCYEYKSAISLEEANVRYATIHYWWYSSWTSNEVGLQELENWLNF
jgi:hypothetical protein